MRRVVLRIIALLLLITAVLAVNAVVLDSETRDAEKTADGGEILKLQTVDLQAFDTPARNKSVEGAPIVLLHCFACSSQWWEPILPLLSQNHRVIRIDLLGHGGSEKPKSGYGIGQQADAVAEALNRLDVSRATVVGHSMGGHVAVKLAEKSEIADRVAVIGTPAEDGQVREFPVAEKLAELPLIGQGLWRIRWDGIVKSGYDDAFAPGFDYETAFSDPDRVVIDNEAMTYTSFDEAGHGSEAFIEEGSNVTRLRETGVPFLAILGAEDQLVDSDAAAASFGEVPGGLVELLDGIGHSPNVEAPEETAQLLLRFAGAAGNPVPIAGAAGKKSKAPGKGQKPKGKKR